MPRVCQAELLEVMPAPGRRASGADDQQITARVDTAQVVPVPTGQHRHDVTAPRLAATPSLGFVAESLSPIFDEPLASRLPARRIFDKGDADRVLH